MRVRGVELRHVALPMRSPFESSHGVETDKQALIVRVVTPDGEGWGECGALAAPTYTSEYLEGALAVTRRFLLPALFSGGDLGPQDVGARLAHVSGHHMAKAAIELAVLDAALRCEGRSLAGYLGATSGRVPAGVAVGLDRDTRRLVNTVVGYAERGYGCVKLKIAPGADLVPVAAVRAALGPDVTLLVDANGAYGANDGDHLIALDELGVSLIEQPLPADDLLGHARLGRRMQTPICLDESIMSGGSLDSALALNACAAVNLKPGRLGGYLEARRIHDRVQACGSAPVVGDFHASRRAEVPNGGVPIGLRCGGMLETGLGRAALLAFAALPGFTLPGDLSASERYFAVDLTEPFVLEDGMLRVPDGPGLGVEPVPDILDAVTTWQEWIPNDD